MMEVVLMYDLDESGKEKGKGYFAVIDGRGRIRGWRFSSFEEAKAWIENVLRLVVDGVPYTELPALFDNISAKAWEERPHALAEDALFEVLEAQKRAYDLLLETGMIKDEVERLM